MKDSYKDFLTSVMSKDSGWFAGGVSDTRLDQIITTIWNGGKI